MNRMVTGYKGNPEVASSIFSEDKKKQLLGYRYLEKFIISAFSNLGEYGYEKKNKQKNQTKPQKNQNTTHQTKTPQP